MGDAFSSGLQAEIAVARRDTRQGVDLGRRRIIKLIQADISAGDIQGI